MIKSLVLKMGELLINIFAVLGVLGGVIMMFAGGAQGIVAGFATILGVVITTFAIYLFLDIRDKLAVIAEK